MNVQATIADCIESILGVDYPRDAFEVIVVDGGSEDLTLEKLSIFEDARVLQDRGGRFPQVETLAYAKPRVR